MKTFRITTDGDAGLGLRRNLSAARGDAVRARTIPLRETASGCAAENVDPNQPGFSELMGEARSNRPRVAGALEENRHALEGRPGPAFFGLSHKDRLF